MSELEKLLLDKYNLLEDLLIVTKRMIDIASDDAETFELEIENREKIINEIKDIDQKIENFASVYDKDDARVVKINSKLKEIIAYDNLLVPNVSRKIRDLRKKHDDAKDKLENDKLDFSAEKKEKGYFLNIKG